MNVIEQLKDADNTLANDGYKRWSYVRIAITEAIKILETPLIDRLYLKMKSQIPDITKEEFEEALELWIHKKLKQKSIDALKAGGGN